MAICFCEQDSHDTDNTSTCTFDNPNINQGYLPEYLKSNSLPREMLDEPALRERMQGLLDLILKYCELKNQNDASDINFDELL